MFAAVIPPRNRKADYLRAFPAPGKPPRPGMVWIPGGSFLMGCDDFYPEERPVREATVSGFWMDRTPVTNAEFARFVRDTGYVTSAEAELDPAAWPELDATMRVPGGLVFHKPKAPVPLNDPAQWWRFVAGAYWRRPAGKAAGIGKQMDHPVVQVSHRDAIAYALWAGKSLPTEPEWEFAARGGLDGARFVWGNQERGPRGEYLANTWQGRFPWQNTKEDGYGTTSPVAAYPANGYGLFDMTGNVWEWTSSAVPDEHANGKRSCCPSSAAKDRRQVRHVLKGGSHLCSPDYCFRYRPAAKSAQEVGGSASHLGFRCIIRP